MVDPLLGFVLVLSALSLCLFLPPTPKGELNVILRWRGCVDLHLYGAFYSAPYPLKGDIGPILYTFTVPFAFSIMSSAMFFGTGE